MSLLEVTIDLSFVQNLTEQVKAPTLVTSIVNWSVCTVRLISGRESARRRGRRCLGRKRNTNGRDRCDKWVGVEMLDKPSAIARELS